MTALHTTINQLNWKDIATQLDVEGYAILPGLLDANAVRNLMLKSTVEKTVRMPLASNDMGRGELFCFHNELPEFLETCRTVFYRHLAVIANRWNEILGVDSRYPTELKDFLRINHDLGQTKKQSHLSRLSVEDHVSLHQRSEGEQIFPMQIVALLSEPGADFQGGEFVMTEQRPRMQSRPLVLPLKLGDVAIIATAQRPFKGAKGYYRVNLKHAISRVRKGERIGMELSFHDAP